MRCLRMQVVPAECRHEILGTKLEVKLKKAQPVAWPTLETSAQKVAANFSNTAVEQPPVYPSSHPRCLEPGRRHSISKHVMS